MLKAVRVALDPTPAQRRALQSHAGAARFAYNAGLAHVIERLEQRRDGETIDVPWNLYALRRWWNEAKLELAPWWSENSKEAYNSGLDALARGLKNFSDSRKGKRKGKRVGFPRFKSRARSRKSFQYTTGAFGVADAYGVKLPRIGRVHTFERVDDRLEAATLKRVTVSEHAGRWYASFTLEVEAEAAAPALGGVVGVDLGVSTLATLSTGEKIQNPKHLREAQRRLRRANKALARTRKGSQGRRRAADRLAKHHARVKHLRADAIHKMTTGLARRFGTIVLEDLNVTGMTKNHRLAQAITDASFAEIRRQLEYKTTRHGGTVVLADRWYPSSKTCSTCGTVKAKLPLTARVFACDACGNTMDRDVNAAINLKNIVAESGSETRNGGGGDVRPGLGQADPREATTTQGSAGNRTAGPQDVDRRLVTTASQ